MPFQPTHDLQCKDPDCGELLPDVTHPEMEYPSCPTCGGPTAITFVLGGFPTVQRFAPRHVAPGVTLETKADVQRHMASLEARYPGEKFDFEYVPPTQAKTRIDEIRHRAATERAASGVDGQALSEWRGRRDAAKKEAAAEALRGNADPAAAAAAAASSLPTPAQVARPVEAAPKLADRSTVLVAGA